MAGKPPSDNKPMSNEEFRQTAQDMMYDDLRKASDFKLPARTRFMYLSGAIDNAEIYRSEFGVRGMPEALVDRQTSERALRSLGQIALIEQARMMNGNPTPVGTNGWLQREALLKSTEEIIKEMARRGLQSEDQSYAVFGGKQRFDQLKAEAAAKRDIKIEEKAAVKSAGLQGAAADIAAISGDPAFDKLIQQQLQRPPQHVALAAPEEKTALKPVAPLPPQLS